MCRYDCLKLTLLTATLIVGIGPTSASGQEGACCHDDTPDTESASKSMVGLFFCEDGVAEIFCTEPEYDNWSWTPGVTCSGPGPFDTLELCEAAVLPVELTRFDALVDNGSIVLVWSTASETNNAGFSVEMDDGANVFAEIGFVDGHGTTNEPKEYTFAARDLDPGLHRFRLKQIDFDGAFEYSSVVEAAVTVPDRFLIEPAYPNPFNPTTTLRFAVATEQHVEVTLINVAGQTIRTLYSGTVVANEMQLLTVDADALPSGTYLVHFEGTGISATERIVLAK